jgi:dephospho-CoA kinase
MSGGWWKGGRSKPVIGITGGIGSGKSTVSQLFGSLGCAVIDSDQLAHEALEAPEMKEELSRWLGEGVIGKDGKVSRRLVGAEVFNDAEKMKRLNGLIHPRVAARREVLMRKYLADEGIKAIVWDTPLLLEAGLDKECDAVVYVDAPVEMRAARVREKRGWGEEELQRREKLQIPLDKKGEIADYYIDNRGDEAQSLGQIQRVLSHLLANQ